MRRVEVFSADERAEQLAQPRLSLGTVAPEKVTSSRGRRLIDGVDEPHRLSLGNLFIGGGRTNLIIFGRGILYIFLLSIFCRTLLCRVRFEYLRSIWVYRNNV